MSAAEEIHYTPDWDAIYNKQIRGEEITREEAILLCDAPAPMHLMLRPYNPGPEYEDRAKILCKYVTADDQIGSIVVPETAKRHSGELIVIDVGHGAWDPDVECSSGEKGAYVDLQNIAVGDRLVVGRYVGQDLNLSWDVTDEEGNPKRISMKFVALFVKDIMAKYE